MATFRGWFNKFTEATGEEITHICFGFDWPGNAEDWPSLPEKQVMSLSEVPDEVLDYEFYASFGSTDSPDLCAWSPNWVIFSCQYDGSEWLCWVPKNPVAHKPIRPGGG